MIDVRPGDMREVLAGMVERGERVQAVVTDPPYHLTSIVKRFGAENAAPAKVGKTGAYARASVGFMGKQWDGGDIAFQAETWRLCWELLPPGGHLLAFGGTRRFHRLVCAIEDAGFEIRDTIAWLYGSGFPKSHNVSKAIDSEAGVEREVIGRRTDRAATPKQDFRGGQHHTGGGINGAYDGSAITAPATDAARQWDGWGTALKPAMELICVARKPLVGTVAANVLAHGAGGLNVDACKISVEGGRPALDSRNYRNLSSNGIYGDGLNGSRAIGETQDGRWPANVCHDGSAEVVAMFPDAGGGFGSENRAKGTGIYGAFSGASQGKPVGFGDSGSAARFFYSAKADKADRLQSVHPTVKPIDLMRWLIRLVTPPGGTVLDPFAGSGTTGMACMAEAFDCILIEREAEHVADIRRRIAHVHGTDTPLFAEAAE